MLVASLAAAALFIALAVLIAWRRWRSAFALVVSAALYLRGVSFIAGLPELAAADALWSPLVSVVRTTYAILVVLLLYAFPDGRFVPRWTLWLWLAWTAWLLATLVRPEASPILAHGAWVAPVLVAVAVSGLVAQLQRYRRASEAQRLQMTWVMFGLGVYVVVFAALQIVAVSLPDVAAATWFPAVATAAEALAASVAALTLAVAILRRRLLEIELIVGRTVVYVGTIAVVAGVFAAMSAVMQRVLLELTGQRSDAANVVVALVIGATFAPVKFFVNDLLARAIRRGQGGMRG